MRLLNLLKGDIRFQYKYGFYVLFLIFSLIYVVMIKVLPQSAQGTISAVLIFTDPTAMGLIFMGAIVHFEFSEKTLNSITVSPVSPFEYLVSKLLSIAVISTFSGLLIGIFTQTINNYSSISIGLFLGSLIFSALGMIIALNTNSMNGFILLVIPAMIFVILPGVAYIIAFDSAWLILHPGIAISELIVHGDKMIIAILSLLVWLVIVVLIAHKILKRRFKHERGVF